MFMRYVLTTVPNLEAQSIAVMYNLAKGQNVSNSWSLIAVSNDNKQYEWLL